MSTTKHPSSTRPDLQEYGLSNLEDIHWNLSSAHLLEYAVRRREGHLAHNGALVVRTGVFTGRSPKDKYMVRDELTEHSVNWGTVNQPITAEAFARIYHRLAAF